MRVNEALLEYHSLETVILMSMPRMCVTIQYDFLHRDILFGKYIDKDAEGIIGLVIDTIC